MEELEEPSLWGVSGTERRLSLGVDGSPGRNSGHAADFMTVQMTGRGMA